MISRRDIGSVEQAIDGRTLSGVAAVYGQRSRELREGGRVFTEVIRAGAFGGSVAGDVKLYYNHDASMPLARTRSNTLTLTDRADGLHYSATLPETSLGNDVRALMARGDLSGEMSFGFYVERDSWNAKRTERTVEAARLVEISIVVDAAYPQTSSQLRSASPEFLDAVRARITLHLNRINNP
jgi:uncharacterized protein